jgi:hypothetical protein
MVPPAAAFTDYASLADHYRDELDGLGEFDVATIDEAKALATTLRERVAKRSSDAKKRSTEALEWRNRLATVLAQEIASVRAAARFVFRHHPTIRREAASAYERRVRAARQRAAANASAPSPTAETTADA